MLQPSQPALLRLMASVPQPVSFQPTESSICKLRWEGLQRGGGADVRETRFRSEISKRAKSQIHKDDLLKAATHLVCVSVSV